MCRKDFQAFAENGGSSVRQDRDKRASNKLEGIGTRYRGPALEAKQAKATGTKSEYLALTRTGAPRPPARALEISGKPHPDRGNEPLNVSHGEKPEARRTFVCQANFE